MRQVSIDGCQRACESTDGSPFPGKCLAVTRSPFARAPRMNAATKAPTPSGSSPNDRSLMTGLVGLLFTSATGASAHWTPIALASCAVMAAKCSTSFTSPTAPNAMGQGKPGTSLRREATPALEISGEEQRQLGFALQLICDPGRVQRRTPQRT